MKLSGVFALICSLTLSLSCSIKEDRSGCPCRLVLDMGRIDTNVVSSVDLLVTASDGFVFRKTLSSDLFSSPYTVTVPRGDVYVCAFDGAAGTVSSDGSLTIIEGYECPRVNMYNSRIHAEGELVRDTVVLHKNHSVMRIIVRSEEPFPFQIAVAGNVSGYDKGGEPVHGNFRFVPERGEDGTFVVTVPRQTDNAMRLEVNDGDAVLKIFALGEYLFSSGYDWTSADLEDVTVSLDYSLTRLSVIVKGWDEEYFFDVVI